MRKLAIVILSIVALSPVLKPLLWSPAFSTPAQDLLVKLGYHVTKGAAAGYIEDRACAVCHSDIAESYQHVGMSQSFSRPRPDKYIEDFKNNHYYHAKSQQHYEMTRRGDDIYFKQYQIDEDGNPINEYEIKVDWLLGSGHKSRSYLYQTGNGELYQLPIGWYTQTKNWGMSPGFDNPSHLGISRLVRRECMFCHNAYPEVPAGSDLRGQPHIFPTNLPEGTGCQRCHGPGAEHTRLALGAAKNIDQLRDAIVNPARLSPERRDDVCFECHLLPAVALIGVRRFDKPVYSYRPGQALSDYALAMDVVETQQPTSERFEINHHAYRLIQSPCYKESNGKLSCLSCHNPHRKVPPSERPAHYRKVCLECHKTHETQPVVNGPSKDAAADDCVACHMQQRRTQDVVQVVMTDHFIRRKPAGAELLTPKEEHTPVLIDAQFLFPDSAPKGIQGKIYRAVAVARAGSTKESIAFLDKTLREHPQDSVEPYLTLAKAQLNNRMSDAALSSLRSALKISPDNIQALRHLGSVHLQRKEYKQAIEVLTRLLAIQPNDGIVQYHMGLALVGQDKLTQAIPFFTNSTKLRANFERSWFYLGYVAYKTNDQAKATVYLRRALAIQPRFTRAYIYLARSLLAQNHRTEAHRYARHGLTHAQSPATIRRELADLL
jgi:predicted CXXCH cytochrome family protein